MPPLLLHVLLLLLLQWMTICAALASTNACTRWRAQMRAAQKLEGLMQQRQQQQSEQLLCAKGSAMQAAGFERLHRHCLLFIRNK